MIGKQFSKYWWRRKFKKIILNKNKYYFLNVICRFRNDENLIFDKKRKIKIVYELNTDIGNVLFFEGCFEEEEIDFVSDRLKLIDKPVILDIGANIGLHSLIWSFRFESRSEIYAFEPSKYTRDILKRNIKINKKCSNIKVIPLAVSNCCGTTFFFDADDNAYSSLKNTERKNIKEKYKVDTITIDKFVADNNMKKIDFLKVDVEGFETEVIEGAKKCLSKFTPDVFIEIYEGTNSNVDANVTIGKLKKLGYIPYILKNKTLQTFKVHSDTDYNYYCIHKEKL
ncbi:MAG: FkbM family methyltransferase [Candidatus Electrothrix sp. AW5]|nr:FkbM family methyltransferase [Candidatus Electrothrix gigas]